ncbi:hypothetical protein CAPTEDRAFT_205528 [Capitella teleta]|uniref:Sulfotransferase domain-containing protein n=1 Tax=Capitella teleta TaxID=283909 RepID=R7VIT1_CAPTE|nr:hypothetical protein CAPTEDRAFT_205528 [Capitella teleta]|eukprot:ELU18467.1 hypothetical protein CAPTEDRAFT_205528 [Capitella teleta]
MAAKVMLNVCEQFSNNFNVLFNADKSALLRCKRCLSHIIRVYVSVEHVIKKQHSIPKEYDIDGVIFGEFISQKKTQQILQQGGGPQYEVLVATYPRAAEEVEQRKRHRPIFLDMYDPDFKSAFMGSVKFPPGEASLAKIHIPQHMMQEYTKRDTKIIVGMRNPKDELLSIYHFYRINKALGNFKRRICGEIFDHNVGWWSIRDRPNTMYVFYEDLTEDPVKEVRRMAEFLGKETCDEAIIKICKHEQNKEHQL